MVISPTDNYEPKVTIITVTYNASSLLEETIQSIVGQDYKNIEFIIIDGNSNDNTVNIIKEYKQYIDYWCSESDKGIYDAMNKGIDLVTGEWVNFMNAGDTFSESNTVSDIISLVENDTEIISGNIKYFDKDNAYIMKPRGLDKVFDGMFCFHQSMFTNIKLLTRYRFNVNYKIAADYDFTLKCYIEGHKFKFINKVVANYLADGISERNTVLAKVEDLFIQSRYFDDLSNLFKLDSFKGIIRDQSSRSLILSQILNSIKSQVQLFEKSKCVIYGYSNFTKSLLLSELNNIVVIVDKEAPNIDNSLVVLPDYLDKYEYDFIIIGVLGRENEIKNYLSSNLKVDDEKIIILDL